MEKTVTASPWIFCPKPRPSARLRLFCFPYGGGGASAFRTWPDDLPRDLGVYAIQLPGREVRLREEPITNIFQVVQTLAQVLLPYLNQPFAFFGHSVGAFIGFELARQLRRQNNLSPLHLFVSGQRAPQIPDPVPPVHQLPDREFIEQVRRRYNGIPHTVLQSKELMDVLLPTLRADFAMSETYTYVEENPLDCPITSFGGQDDIEVKHENLAAWQVQTHNFFNLRMFPGDHFFIQSEKSSLLQAVTNDLYQSINVNIRGERSDKIQTFSGASLLDK